MRGSLCTKEFIPGVDEQDTCAQCLTDTKGEDEYQVDRLTDDLTEIILPKFPYLIIVDAYALNYRSGPGMNYPVNGVIYRNEVHTIVEESDGPGDSKWGRLKSGVGWVSLDLMKKMR